MDNNIKCTKCGYIFDYSGNSKTCTCPLCSNEFDVNEGKQNFKNSYASSTHEYKKKSIAKIILDWTIFGVSFAAFIIILYFIFNFIVNYS